MRKREVKVGAEVSYRYCAGVKPVKFVVLSRSMHDEKGSVVPYETGTVYVHAKVRDTETDLVHYVRLLNLEMYAAAAEKHEMYTTLVGQLQALNAAQTAREARFVAGLSAYLGDGFEVTCKKGAVKVEFLMRSFHQRFKCGTSEATGSP